MNAGLDAGVGKTGLAKGLPGEVLGGHLLVVDFRPVIVSPKQGLFGAQLHEKMRSDGPGTLQPQRSAVAIDAVRTHNLVECFMFKHKAGGGEQRCQQRGLAIFLVQKKQENVMFVTFLFVAVGYMDNTHLFIKREPY